MSLSKTLLRLSSLGLLGLAATTVQAQQDQPQQPQTGNQAQAGNAGSQNGDAANFQQMPWFSNPAIRQQLQLNEEQFNRLNQSYRQGWEQYNQGLSGLDKQLNEQQRMQRLLELNQGLYKKYTTDIDETIADRAARQRFRQMDWQYRGYGAFYDPTVQQQLNLTDEQLFKLQQFQNEWNNQMGIWRREFANDRSGVTKNFRESRREMLQRINSLLNPQQRKAWMEIIGKPFEFPADVYFEIDPDIAPRAQK